MPISIVCNNHDLNSWTRTRSRMVDRRPSNTNKLVTCNRAQISIVSLMMMDGRAWREDSLTFGCGRSYRLVLSTNQFGSMTFDTNRWMRRNWAGASGESYLRLVVVHRKHLGGNPGRLLCLRCVFNHHGPINIGTVHHN